MSDNFVEAASALRTAALQQAQSVAETSLEEAKADLASRTQVLADPQMESCRPGYRASNSMPASRRATPSFSKRPCALPYAPQSAIRWRRSGNWPLVMPSSVDCTSSGQWRQPQNRRDDRGQSLWRKEQKRGVPRVNDGTSFLNSTPLTPHRQPLRGAVVSRA